MLFILAAGHTGKRSREEKKEPVLREELKEHGGRTGVETKHAPPGEDKGLSSRSSSSTAQAQQTTSAPQLVIPATVLDKPPSILERAAALSQTLERPPITPTSQKKIPSTIPHAPAAPQNLQQERGHDPAPDLRNSTQDTVSKQHTSKAEPADQRTEPPLSE